MIPDYIIIDFDSTFITEESLDELAKYLFDDLQLPDLEKKSNNTVTAEKIKRKGYRTKGIRARLSKKKCYFKTTSKRIRKRRKIN